MTYDLWELFCLVPLPFFLSTSGVCEFGYAVSYFLFIVFFCSVGSSGFRVEVRGLDPAGILEMSCRVLYDGLR